MTETAQVKAAQRLRRYRATEETLEAIYGEPEIDGCTPYDCYRHDLETLAYYAVALLSRQDAEAYTIKPLAWEQWEHSPYVWVADSVIGRFNTRGNGSGWTWWLDGKPSSHCDSLESGKAACEQYCREKMREALVPVGVADHNSSTNSDPIVAEEAGKAVDEGWLRSIGGLPEDSGASELFFKLWLPHEGHERRFDDGKGESTHMYICCDDGEYGFESYDEHGKTLAIVTVGRVSTRGQVLSLLAALGISVKGGGT